MESKWTVKRLPTSRRSLIGVLIHPSIDVEWKLCFTKASLMGLPHYLIEVLILYFCAPMALIVHDSVRLDRRIHPTSGIRQGRPLSPTLFALLIPPIAVYLSGVNSCIEILLWANDLPIIITPPPRMAATLLLHCLDFFSPPHQLRQIMDFAG